MALRRNWRVIAQSLPYDLKTETAIDERRFYVDKIGIRLPNRFVRFSGVLVKTQPTFVNLLPDWRGFMVFCAKPTRL
jgi:hypothetical protein